MSRSTAASDSEPVARSARSSGSALGRMLRKLLRHKLGVVGLAVTGIFMVCAIFAPLIAPYDPTEIFWEALIAPPSAEHWLGTDEIGRDVLSRLIYGARVSLRVVCIAIIGALVIGSAIGLAAGYFGGWVDNISMRIMDGMIAFPTLILALGIIAVLGPNLTNATLAVMLVNVPGFARLARSQTLYIRELDFVQAARVLGVGRVRVLTRHIWPSLVGNIIVYASLGASSALITESSLAFLGLGAEPPTPSWGQMLAVAMGYGEAWWLTIFPRLTIFLTALAFNFLGDGLRDALDARMDF